MRDAVIFHRPSQPLGQVNCRLIVENLAAKRDICQAVAHIAGALGLKQRLHVGAHDGVKLAEQVEQADRRPAADVEHPSFRSLAVRRQQVRLYHILNVREVARLSAVAVNERLLARQDCLDE